MAKHSPVERMRSLHEQIAYHGHKYFVEDDPQITDPEYDKLYREFSELCDKHPELATEFEFANKPVPIAEPTGEMLKTASFSVPMLGSKKANSVEEIEAFQKTFNPGTTFVYEQKVDGLALEARYVHSAANLLVLDRIATRGAGMVGEDVTHSLRLFSQTSGIPGQILWSPEYGPQPEEFLVRGEGYVTHAIFDLLNEGYEKKKATPRNAVAGWIRALPENQDESVVGQLQFAAYWTSHRLDKNSYHGQRNKLIAMRLLPAEVVKFNDIQQNKRGTEIPVDGIMVKADQFSEWDRVGSSAKFPNYMIAYKYPNEEVHSPMETVEWNTSRFGRVVPTGKYRPVKIGGVMCRSASLDNYGSFMDLGLSVGDVVSVTRNNDVVPRINSIVEHADGPLLEAPTECPSCSYLLEVQVGKTSSDLVCNNVSACPAQLVRRCMNLVDKFGLDIDGLGPTLISVLVSAGYVGKPADLLALPVSAQLFVRNRVRENIERARFQPVYRFIKALGLPGVGIVLAKRIANKISAIAERVDNVEGVIEDALTDVNLLLSVKGISTGGALAITNAFNDATFEENFGDLYDVMELDYTAVPENDLRVAVTGTLEGSREELVEYFANASIELTDKLTKDCSYLIVGERPGKAKLLKATELSIPTLTVSEFSSVDAVIQTIKGAVQ